MRTTTNNNPMVSVLMTVYNREKYLSKAIKSVLSSTYSDFELIIVDDRSTDTSVRIASDYKSIDPRVKVYINEKNLGDYHNRNKAASLASGKYLKYVDADDMIYPGGLETMVTMMEENPEAGFGLSSLEQDKDRIFPFLLNGEEAYRRHYFEQPLFHKAPLSAIIRKDAFEELGGFTGKRYLGDFEMWHLLAEKFPVLLMPHGMVWYREHEEQEMHFNRTDHFIPFKYLQCSENLLKRSTCPLNESDREKALKKIHWNQSRYILGIGKNHSLSTMNQLKKLTNFSYFNIIKRVIQKAV